MTHLTNPEIKLGIVPTHLKFEGGLAPQESGKLPRDETGTIKTISNLRQLLQSPAISIDCCQISQFPGTSQADLAELVAGIRDLGIEVQFVMMVSGVDPLNPADRNKVVELLVNGLEAAKQHGVAQVASTSMEAWMSGTPAKTGRDFESAIAHLVELHIEAYQQADVANSSISAWEFEFLREGEFQTFTDLGKAWQLVRAANDSLGKPFFKLLVDAAHCGDSTLTIHQNQTLIREIAGAGAMGSFHCSAKTTRGCFSTDDGWIGALLATAVQTKQLTHVFVEYFHHQDPALKQLRDLIPGHGIDTTDGRTYDQMVIDGLIETRRRLHNLQSRPM